MNAASEPTASPSTPLLLNLQQTILPLILCFHGSNASSSSWQPLIRLLAEAPASYRILLPSRPSPEPSPQTTISTLLTYLHESGLPPPYILVAHSYGGLLARLFLDACSKGGEIVGMVLAETGQETALSPALETKQYRKPILGGAPLSVIRCNSLLAKWKEYDAAEATPATLQDNDETKAAKQAAQAMRRKALDAWDAEDERLKKKQLELSKNSRYVHVPDCGHNVIRERPDVVAEEVRWVVETWKAQQETAAGEHESKSRGFRALTIKVLHVLPVVLRKVTTKQ